MSLGDRCKELESQEAMRKALPGITYYGNLENVLLGIEEPIE